MAKQASRVARAVEDAADLAHERQHEREVSALKNKLAASEQKRKLAEQELSEAYERADFLDSLGRPTPAQFDQRKTVAHGSATAIILFSDWHVEEEIDPSTADFRNKFNLEIATKRIKTTVERAVELIEVERRLSNIRDLVVGVLGDMFSGYIHDELKETNCMSPIEASLYVQDQLVGAVEFFKRHAGCKSIILPTAVGNHGRTTEKLRFATEYKNSYEWLLYRQLERYYRNDPKVHWKVSNSYVNWLDVQGHKCRFSHGHRVKYRGGVGGPTVAVNNTIYRMNRTEQADQDFMGHLHTHIRDDKFVVNNCLNGYGAMSIARGFLPPSQTLVVLDKKRKPPVCVKEIFCD